MKKKISFEQALQRLDDIVASLEQDNIPLEDSLKQFSEGAELLAYCNKQLEDAQLKIETLFPERDKDGGKGEVEQ